MPVWVRAGTQKYIMAMAAASIMSMRHMGATSRRRVPRRRRPKLPSHVSILTLVMPSMTSPAGKSPDLTVLDTMG